MKLLLFVIATLCCSYTFGQDLLYTKNKGTLKVKVTEIADNFVKYRLHGMDDGPVYTTTRRFVDSIVYQNGMVERFTAIPEPRRRATKQQLEDAFTNQFSGGVHVFGADVNSTTFENGTDLKNPFAVGVYVKYQKEILRKRIGLYVAPFFAFNKEAYGSAFGAKFNIKRLGKATIGVGPEYILSVQDIIEKFYGSSPDIDGNFDYYRKYRSAVSFMTFNANMNLHLKPNLSATFDAGVGGVIASSKREENKIAKVDGFYQSGVTGSFRVGLGYWF